MAKSCTKISAAFYAIFITIYQCQEQQADQATASAASTNRTHQRCPRIAPRSQHPQRGAPASTSPGQQRQRRPLPRPAVSLRAPPAPGRDEGGRQNQGMRRKRRAREKGEKERKKQGAIKNFPTFRFQSHTIPNLAHTSAASRPPSGAFTNESALYQERKSAFYNSTFWGKAELKAEFTRLDKPR